MDVIVIMVDLFEEDISFVEFVGVKPSGQWRHVLRRVISHLIIHLIIERCNAFVMRVPGRGWGRRGVRFWLFKFGKAGLNRLELGAKG